MFSFWKKDKINNQSKFFCFFIEDFHNQALSRPSLVNDLEFAITQVDLFPGDVNIDQDIFCAYADFTEDFEKEHPSFSIEKAIAVFRKFGLKASLKETWMAKE